MIVLNFPSARQAHHIIRIVLSLDALHPSMIASEYVANRCSIIGVVSVDHHVRIAEGDRLPLRSRELLEFRARVQDGALDERVCRREGIGPSDRGREECEVARGGIGRARPVR